MVRLSPEQQKQVTMLTDEAIDFISKTLNNPFQKIEVLFDLSGRAAGMYVHKYGKQYIRYNPYIFAKYFSDNISVTIPHEVSHYVVDCLYGIQNTRPHGKEWKTIMDIFSVDKSVTCHFDFTGVPMKQYQRIEYQCQCRPHELTKIRHNRIKRGFKYHCRHCRTELVQAAS